MDNNCWMIDELRRYAGFRIAGSNLFEKIVTAKKIADVASLRLWRVFNDLIAIGHTELMSREDVQATARLATAIENAILIGLLSSADMQMISLCADRHRLLADCDVVGGADEFRAGLVSKKRCQAVIGDESMTLVVGVLQEAADIIGLFFGFSCIGPAEMRRMAKTRSKLLTAISLIEVENERRKQAVLLPV